MALFCILTIGDYREITIRKQGKPLKKVLYINIQYVNLAFDIVLKLSAMKESCQKYEQQITKAKETIGLIEQELHQVRLKLQNDPNNAIYMQELKNISLDMTITLNELEHSESALENCISQQNS